MGGSVERWSATWTSIRTGLQDAPAGSVGCATFVPHCTLLLRPSWCRLDPDSFRNCTSVLEATARLADGPLPAPFDEIFRGRGSLLHRPAE